MQFDRKMVGYLQEIKRRLPPESRAKFKFSEPYIEEVVFELYQSTSNAQLKVLSKAFLEMLSPEWEEKIRPPKLNAFDNAVDQGVVILDKVFNALTTPITLGKSH